MKFIDIYNKNTYVNEYCYGEAVLHNQKVMYKKINKTNTLIKLLLCGCGYLVYKNNEKVKDFIDCKILYKFKSNH